MDNMPANTKNVKSYVNDNVVCWTKQRRTHRSLKKGYVALEATQIKSETEEVLLHAATC